MSGARFGKFRLKSGAIFPDNRSVDELTREFLIESQESLDRMERCLTELEERPQDGGLLAEIFRSVHTIKGTTGFLGYSRLESLSHAGENLLGLLRDGKLLANAAIISTLFALLDTLRAILNSIESAGSEGEGQGHGHGQDYDQDRAMIERLIDLQTGECVGTGRKADEAGPALTAGSGAGLRFLHSVPGPALPAAGGNAAAENIGSKTAASATDSTLSVNVDLLNRMMNLVGELVLTRNQIVQAADKGTGCPQLAHRLDMVTADLRETVMKARMQPVSQVFSRIPRLVRDLAQQLGKRVRLEMEGQETELDKSLLGAIKDPLIHAVRNAIDHGLERPARREAAGKPAEGVLWLRAYQDRSHVIVEIDDDGGGIGVDLVREKAIERRLITGEKAAQMSERELLQLIFLPGFSTSPSVTNVSGRGVGLDVVRTNVEKIGGKVEIESRAGKGTTLRLRVPLTLAILPALIVHSRGHSFALPQGALQELVHLSADQSRDQIEWLELAPLYRLRGRRLPLVFLGGLVDQVDQKEAAAEQEACYIAVLNATGLCFGLVIDGFANLEEIVVKPLSPVLRQIGLFSGATVMGNGEMALVLDPGALAALAEAGIDTAAPGLTLLRETVARVLDPGRISPLSPEEQALALEVAV